MRDKIRQQEDAVLDRLREYRRLKISGETLCEWQAKEKDAQFRLRFYAQHGMEEKLARHTTFGRDERYLSCTTARATRALDSLQEVITETLDELKQEHKHESVHNQAGSPLQIVPSFANDKKAMQAVLKEAFTGSRLRESTYQTVSDSFRDFGELWLNRDKQSGIVSGSAETFSEYLEQKTESLITWQIPNTYWVREQRFNAVCSESAG